MVCTVSHNLMPFWACVYWYSKYVAHCLTMHSIFAFMLIQYTDSLLWNFIFCIPMWLLCIWSSICFCIEKGMINCFPFISTPSIIVKLGLICHYPPKLWSKLSFFFGHHLMCVCTSGLLHLYLQFWCLLLMCRLECLLPCWVYVCWCSFQLFPGLYTWCDCDRIVNLLCTGLVQVCIIL